MPSTELTTIAAWLPGALPPAFDPPALLSLLERVREPLHVVREGARGRIGVAQGGQIQMLPASGSALPLLATLPALYPEWLGDRSFLEIHGVRFPYVAGEMANGIATTDMVIAMARADMLGFFGAAGLSPGRVEAALVELRGALGTEAFSWGANLIHSLGDPALEEAIVDLYLAYGVRRVSASAFMALTPSIVRYALTGITRDANGRIRRTNHVFAKISRPEVARPFMSPAPQAMVEQLLAQGRLTALEADLARFVPIAEDFTVESDSGGHTDNRPLAALFPTIMALRTELSEKYAFSRPIRIGAAGGLGTPSSLAAAFQLGAAYVMTGSINQGALEAGQSVEVKRMLAQAQLADVVMAPAGDMFEAGVKVQVLRKGTMFANRGARLYELYNAHDSLDQLDSDVRAKLEKEIFQQPLEAVWTQTRTYFLERDPAQVTRAERDPKHLMALVFRWYLGQSSRWAIAGIPERKLDYQIWCGPAMGAFNTWTAGTFLADPARRGVVPIALNLLEGAAVITRAQQLRTYGVAVPPAAFDFRPRELALASPNGL